MRSRHVHVAMIFPSRQSPYYMDMELETKPPVSIKTSGNQIMIPLTLIFSQPGEET